MVMLCLLETAFKVNNMQMLSLQLVALPPNDKKNQKQFKQL